MMKDEIFLSAGKRMNNPGKEKAMLFSVRIVKLHQFLRREKKEFTISDQILRSGTSIGANIAEAEYAASDKDMLNKLQIALKEAAETCYWLELLYRTDFVQEKQFISLMNDCVELRKLLAASTRSLSVKLQKAAKPI